MMHRNFSRNDKTAKQNNSIVSTQKIIIQSERDLAEFIQISGQGQKHWNFNRDALYDRNDSISII